ncbi:MAG: hypothetical protein ABL925_12335 [Methylococcales bacterium]
MNTPISLAYKAADMPQHLDSAIAIAYNTTIGTACLAEINYHLDSLQSADFEIANQGYLAIRDDKRCGRIVDYASAATKNAALLDLQQTLMTVNNQQASALQSRQGVLQYVYLWIGYWWGAKRSGYLHS